MNNNTFLHLTKQLNFIFNSSNSQTYRLVCCSPTNELQFQLSQSVAGKISSRVGTSAVLQILTTATLPTSTEQKSPTTHCHWHLSFVTCHLSFVNLSFVICHLQNHCHSCHSCCVLPNLDIKPGSAYHGDWQTPCIASTSHFTSDKFYLQNCKPKLLFEESIQHNPERKNSFLQSHKFNIQQLKISFEGKERQIKSAL